MKVRSPEKFMTVSVVKVSPVDVLLSLSMAIKANSAIMKEQIWMNRVASELCQPFLPDIGTSFHDERVIVVARSRICILFATSEVSLMEKRAKLNEQKVLRGHSLKIEVCQRRVRTGFRVHSSFPNPEANSD